MTYEQNKCSPKSCFLILFIAILICFCGKADGEICVSSVCSYNFVLRHHKIMTYETNSPGAVRPSTYDVVLNGSNLIVAANLFRPANVGGVIDPNIGKVVSSDDVITADGYPRYIVTINGQFPGPTIEVTQGSTVNK